MPKKQGRTKQKLLQREAELERRGDRIGDPPFVVTVSLVLETEPSYKKDEYTNEKVSLSRA